MTRASVHCAERIVATSKPVYEEWQPWVVGVLEDMIARIEAGEIVVMRVVTEPNMLKLRYHRTGEPWQDRTLWTDDEGWTDAERNHRPPLDPERGH